MNYVGLKEKYEKKLARLNCNIEAWENCDNAELRTAVSTLKKEKEEVQLILNAINSQIWTASGVITKEGMVFELGKIYKHTTGEQMKIVGEANTTVYGYCLIGEKATGDLIPVGTHESNTVNYTEISEEEWMKNFTDKDDK